MQKLKHFILIPLLCSSYIFAEIERPSLTADEIEIISNNPEYEYVYIDLKTRNTLSKLKNLLPNYKFSQQTDDTIAYITSGGTSTYKTTAQSIIDECIGAVEANRELINKTSDIGQVKSNLSAYQEELNNNSAQIIVEDNSDTNLNDTITKGRKKKVYCKLTVKDCLKVCGTLKAKNACIGNLIVAGNEIVGGDLTVNGRLIVNNAVLGGATGATGATGPIDIPGTPFAIALFDGSGGLTESTGTPPVEIIGVNNVTGVNDLNMNNNLNMLNTTSASIGVINKSSTRFIHDYPGNGTNFFAGSGAGNFTMSGTGNIGIGNSALISNTSGRSNVAIGLESISNGNGFINTAVGYQALRTVDSDSNVAVGAGALFSGGNVGGNTAVGALSLQNGSGGLNTAVGFLALNSATFNGVSNIAIGAAAGNAYSGSETQNILIGNDGIATETNTIRIGGSGSQNRCFIEGIRDVTTGIADAIAVLIDSAGQLGTVSSSARYKENIKDMKEKSSNIMKLRPVTFNFKADKTASQQYGLIAEEVDEIMKDLVVYKDGKPESVKYHILSVLLLNELQKLSKKVEALEKARK